MSSGICSVPLSGRAIELFLAFQSMPSPFYTSRRSRLNRQERLCPPSSVLSRAKSRLLANLHSATTRLTSAIKSLPRKHRAMGSVRPGDGDFWDSFCDVKISNKRKILPPDFYLDLLILLFTKRRKGLSRFSTPIVCFSQEQKLGLYESQHDSPLNILKIEDIKQSG